MGKEQKNNIKTFTIVELLAVIVILGLLAFVGISALSKYIEKTKNESDKKAKQTLLSATKLYLQNNKDITPKSIGEYKIITAKELKNNNYLKSTLKNIKGESCINESFVKEFWIF